MAGSNYTVKLGALTMTPSSTAQFIERKSIDLSDDLGQRSKGTFKVIDTTGTYRFANGLPVWIYDATGEVVWSGAVAEDKEKRVAKRSGAIRHTITCFDGSYFVAKRLVAKSYQAVLAGNIVGDLCASYFNAEGVLGTRATPVFARSSVAYYANGSTDPYVSQVTSNNPRYEAGPFGGSKAIRIEQGTTNLLTANQSSVETNTTGFSAAASTLLATGATITRDTNHKYEGAAALKIVTTNALSGEGAEANITSLSANTTYAVSVWLDGTGGQTWQLAARDFTNSVQVTQNIVLGADWTRVSLAITTGASAVTDFRMAVKTTSAVAQTVWADGWQVEAKANPTSWQVGGTARAKETLQLPAYGNIRPDMGTIELRAYIDSQSRLQDGSSRYLCGIDIAPGGSGGALFLYHSSNTAKWVHGINSTQFPQCDDSFTPDGWHHFAIAWDSSSSLVYIDGVERIRQNNPTFATKLAPYLYIGSDGGSNQQGGNLIADVRTDIRKRTASEIAADAAASTWAAQLETTNYLATFNSTLASSSSIEDGPSIQNSILNYAHGDKALDALAEASSFYWNVDRYRLLHFRARSSIAGQAITGDSVLEDMDSVEVAYNRPYYVNREFVPGTDITSLQTENVKGDGSTRAFAFAYPLAKVPTAVTVNAVAKTLGIKGVDTGKDWYWQSGDNVLAQDTAGTLLTSADTLQLQYYGTFPTVFTAEDTSEVLSNQANEGSDTTGYYDEVDNVPGANTSAASAQYAAGKLARFSQRGQIIQFRTRVAGFHSGQLCVADIPSHGVSAQPVLVESVRASDDGLDIYYDVKAVDGPTSSNWLDFFKAIENKIREVDSVNVGAGAPLVISNSPSETWTWTESVAQTVTTCLFPGAAVFPGATQYPC